MFNECLSIVLHFIV